MIAAALVQAVLCALIAVCWVAAGGAARKRLVQGGSGASATVLVLTLIAVFAIGMRGLAADAFAVTVGFLCATGLVLTAFVTGLLALNAAALSERYRKD